MDRAAHQECRVAVLSYTGEAHSAHAGTLDRQSVYFSSPEKLLGYNRGLATRVTVLGRACS